MLNDVISRFELMNIILFLSKKSIFVILVKYMNLSHLTRIPCYIGTYNVTYLTLVIRKVIMETINPEITVGDIANIGSYLPKWKQLVSN